MLLSAVVILTLGSVTLALQSSTPPLTQSLRDNIATRISDLPLFVQHAARSTIELVITDNGHISSTAAMVISPGNLAVTTTPIPKGASIVGSSQVHTRFLVTLVSRDRALGFTVVRLSRVQPVTPTGVLPNSAVVTAISPYFSPRASTPEIAWAPTTLGDPVIESADGVVSYLATASAPNLNGFVAALAVDDTGNVVAILSSKNQWYSAQYITKVAQVVSSNGGCHARLGVRAVSSTNGGVVITKVLRGPSWHRLYPGDVIGKINGSPLDSYDGLLAYLYAAPAQSTTNFEIFRKNHEMAVGVILGCQP